MTKSTQKIKPLFFGQLVDGDGSYYDHVNNTTRVFNNETGETVTYEGLVKLGKFATESEIAVDEDKVLVDEGVNKTTIKQLKQSLCKST